MNDLERLGRPGAYRLGMLRARGAEPVPPKPYRPSFARRSRRGPASARVLAALAGVAAVARGRRPGQVQLSDTRIDGSDETEAQVRILGGTRAGENRSARAERASPRDGMPDGQADRQVSVLGQSRADRPRAHPPTSPPGPNVLTNLIRLGPPSPRRS
jgi:hypothetical protein